MLKRDAHNTPLLSTPGARALLASSVVARLPLAMFSVALLVNAHHLTGSFGIAGAVCGAYAIGSAAGAPLLGALVDRGGQTRVLLGSSTVAALLLVTNGLLPAGVPAPVLIVLGAAVGLATPPLEACVRTLLPAIVSDPSRLPAMFAFESTVLELTFLFGPPLALGVGAAWSTGAALVLSGLVMLAGTVAFAAQPFSRRWRPDQPVTRARGGALRSPAIRTLILILIGLGTVFGATEVGVIGATHALGSAAAAGPLLALWGIGSLLGGVAMTRLGGAVRTARGVTVLLTALALAHGALIFASGSLVAIAVLITLAGSTIAPTVASIYAMVDAAAPEGSETEAFSWLVTAELIGAAVGAAVAGTVVQHAGAPAAFALVGAAGGVAALVSLLRLGGAQAGSTSQNANPPRSTRSPSSQGIAASNIGPA